MYLFCTFSISSIYKVDSPKDSSEAAKSKSKVGGAGISSSMKKVFRRKNSGNGRPSSNGDKKGKRNSAPNMGESKYNICTHII